MPKNIVLCLDGTGNQLKAKGNTNVVKLYEMLDLSDPDKQIAFYDPGVGTFSAAGAWTPGARWISRLFGLAFGVGMRANLAEAYVYLMQNYADGDRVFVFGFSRGAYTARALIGLLKAVGLMRAGSENLVPYAIGVYAKNGDWSDADWSQLHQFTGAFARPVGQAFALPIDYVGLWDSVKAAGVLKWNLHWLYTRKIPNVLAGRHAVSIDEKRRPYHEYLVEDQPPVVDEVWFAGVHSDVGGTFDDDPRLPRITLKWVVDGALDHGLLVRPGVYGTTCALTVDNAQGTVHKMGWVWALTTYRRRTVPVGARVHSSVQERGKKLSYRPRYAGDVQWDDADWLVAHPGMS